MEEAKSELFQKMVKGSLTFWKVIHEPYLDRELNRSQVRDVISQGLLHARGSYRRMNMLFNVRPDHYQKFMDFLRHHRLKPKTEFEVNCGIHNLNFVDEQ